MRLILRIWVDILGVRILSKSLMGSRSDTLLLVALVENCVVFSNPSQFTVTDWKIRHSLFESKILWMKWKCFQIHSWKRVSWAGVEPRPADPEESMLPFHHSVSLYSWGEKGAIYIMATFASYIYYPSEHQMCAWFCKSATCPLTEKKAMKNFEANIKRK